MRALLPLSADPVTNGHLSLLRSARERFDEVVVALLDNDLKHGRYLFTLEERLTFLTNAVRRLPMDGMRVVAEPDALLADVYLREGCDAIVRGVRSDAELGRERAQNRLHDYVLPGISRRFVYVPAEDASRDISSTFVKAFVSHGLDVSPYVPLCVKEALEERILGRVTVGVTGPIASGKSWVSAKLAEVLPALGVPCRHVSYDALLRDLYTEKAPGAERVREEIATLLGADVRGDDGSLSRGAMADRLFHPDCPMETRRAVEALTAPHVFRLERERLAGFRGLVLVECATLVDMGLEKRANNRVIVVDAPERATMLAERRIDPDRAANMARHQSTVDALVATLESRVAQSGHGSVLRYVNRRRDTSEASTADIRALVAAVFDLFPALSEVEGPTLQPEVTS